MQQRITEFFENNKRLDVDRMSSMDILKNLITEAEYEAGLARFSAEKTSSSSSPRSPRSHHSSKEINWDEVDGGARKKRKSRKTRKSRKSRKTAKRRSKK